MTRLAKQILVPRGVKSRLAKEMKASRKSIKIALDGNLTTLKQYEIREKAKKMGGIELPEN